jgi:hypothetical protein
MASKRCNRSLKTTKKEEKMAKLTAWLVTLIGILLVLPLVSVDIGVKLSAWIIAVAVLVIGLAKLARNYKIL